MAKNSKETDKQVNEKQNLEKMCLICHKVIKKKVHNSLNISLNDRKKALNFYIRNN